LHHAINCDIVGCVMQLTTVAAVGAGTRPGDLQPATRLLHIAHGSDGSAPGQYLCGAPIRRLIGITRQGHGPRGGGVCSVCARLDGRRRDH